MYYELSLLFILSRNKHLHVVSKNEDTTKNKTEEKKESKMR